MAHPFQLGGAVLGLFLLTPPAARAADEVALRRAVERGVAYLRSNQEKGGTWTAGFTSGHNPGINALAALALLECGVAPDDPAIQQAAAALREASTTLTDTYSLSLALLFFDRLGEEGDVPLIESLTVRLLGGQDDTGGWTYFCPGIRESEVRRLKTAIERRNPAPRKQPAPKAHRRFQDLPAEIREQLAFIDRRQPPSNLLKTADNSNTQFATLALWVGRRHGLPVEKALARVEARFHASQTAEGGWNYVPGLVGNLAGFGTNASMTCAGLLGLAIAYGLANEAVLRTELPGERPALRRPDPNRDPAVFGGLRALGRMLPLVLTRPTPVEPAPFPRGGLQKDDLAAVARSELETLLGNHYCSIYYFLWSLERVAVAYGLRTIGGRDWYELGSALIVGSQAQDGSWQSKATGGVIDTCFALLFLRRANLAPDLTVTLQGQVRDPGVVQLRTGNGGDPGRPAGDTAASRLANQVVQARGNRQEALLKKLQEGKGLVYTQALASAIPRLQGLAKDKAREALAERLARMKAATVRDKLTDEDREIRRAAALACAVKGDKSLVPDLIKVLADEEPVVARAAWVALKALTGEDFGPDIDAGRAARRQAMNRWKEWWAKQDK